MPSATVVIPARYESSRFPGKILADRTGKTLIQHVYEQAGRASCVDRIVVATDDERIRAAVAGFGGEVIMTRADHANGTSRIAEAAEAIEADFVVNIQGDEPEIEPEIVDLAVRELSEHDACAVGTIGTPFRAGEDASDPNIVKVVRDRAGVALYFSRALIPCHREPDAAARVEVLRHVGLYVYRPSFLATYARLSPTPLEQAERLEQLRVLEHGYRIHVAVGASSHHGIDTPEQYEAFVERTS